MFAEIKPNDVILGKQCEITLQRLLHSGQCSLKVQTYPGWKLELKADANPGNTGDDAAAACSGATDATEDGVAADSPMNEDKTGLPAACPPDTPRPGKAEGLGPGGRPGNTGAEVRPRLKAEAALGPPLGARPG